MRTLAERLDAAAERIEARLVKGSCWLWPGGTNGNGYGRVSVKTGDGRKAVEVYVHRAMYEKHIGPIPDRMEIDHVCRVRNCARPAHLEVVTHAENVRRAAAHVTHCPQGHPYNAANTRRRPDTGKRSCRTCGRDAAWLRRHPGESLDSAARRGAYIK